MTVHAGLALLYDLERSALRQCAFVSPIDPDMANATASTSIMSYRRRVTDPVLPTDMVARPLPHLEGADPYLARHFRVLTFDGRDKGKSDRPAETQAYTRQALDEDAIAVMDATDLSPGTSTGDSVDG